ncbi:MAG TPA: D-alanyl-D-alanine carboxypeptidase [Acidimicrobiales bacterium]|jgi:D-alanyl-D-alanine carboxypeptidase/D-alanyl-D-alanine-endopeptidase (penicillin-binding protein 4)|nr:D-alanyl-D-alanine carboxypeptidase [Acidimicrobiales bacterium]
MLRRALLAAVLSASLLTGPAATAAPNRPRAGAPATGSATPLLSVRRDPTWVEDTLAGQRASRALAVATKGLGPAVCVDVEQGGHPLYQLHPAEQLEPASNMKLLTSAAALATLGAGFRYTTRVVASAKPVGNTLTGNLYLVGGGDPDLFTAAYDQQLYFNEPSYTSLDALAAAVRRAGITTITGSVIGDAVRYDNQIGVATWDPIYLAESDVAPLSALEVNDGGPPPAGPGQPGDTGPANPPLFAAQAFTAVLKSAGVTVTGPATDAPAPKRTVPVAQIESPPLSALIEQMLRVSDDTVAELVTKELGYREEGQGSTAAGTAQIRRVMAAEGLPVTQLVALDGSGLDTGDRATCPLLTGALEKAGMSGSIAAGLPVAARSGTLARRFVGTAAAGRIHAKTGTLGQVSALSGYVVPARAGTTELAEPVWFSIIINAMPSAQAAPLVDRIAVAIADYPQIPTFRDLEPDR